MSYYRAQNHKFFAVYTNCCNPVKGYAHIKRLQKWVSEQSDSHQLEIINLETLLERASVEVEVVALFTGKTVKLLASQVGGPCDPSTERYYSM